MSMRKLSFKWFGSLANLSFRRSSDKSDSKSTQPKSGGDLGEASDCDAVAVETTVDDMGAMRPRTASYVRSSENYTHMGTLPRLLWKKKDKGNKGKAAEGGGPSSSSSSSSKKSKDKSIRRCQSQRPAGHKDPLRSNAISSNLSRHKAAGNSDPDLSRKPFTDLKLQPEPTEETSPSFSGPTVVCEDVSPSCGQSTTLQETTQGHADLKNPSLPLSQRKERTRTHEHDELEFETTSDKTEATEGAEEGEQKSNSTHSHMEPTESQAEYVQFSKEKYLLESPPEKLRKELEEELKLSPADIRSHGWYHGHIPREVSETLVVRNGDFLVRDSLTNVGDYVLTCRWSNEVLHLTISKVLVKSSDTKVQYMLETDSFDSVQELVRYYIGQRKPVSQSSGVHIYCPVSRTLPLRYLEATFALSNNKQGSGYSPSSQRGAYIKRRSVTMTDGLTTEKMIPHSPSTIHHHKDAMRNCAMSMDQIQEYRCPLSPVGETPMSPAYSAITRQRAHSGGRVLAVVPPSPVMRHSSDPQLSPSTGNNPPEHPAHTSHSAHSSPAHHPGYQSHSSETAGSYCDLRPCPAGPPKPPTKSYVERLRVEERKEEGAREGEEMFCTPQMETTSSFRPSRYESRLMPPENKPLEMSVLKRVKELLAEVDARTAAKHITMADCTVARILCVNSEMQRMMGVSSGLELLTLPHGHQLRLDLMERFYTMSIMMAVDLLGCTGSTEERAALLHKTIQLAAELKSNMGNMFGFAAVMRALELPQISRLEQTWVTLRQRHTEGAILYEKKLKPFMKNMNDGKESSVLSSTSFPHIIPVLSLLERGLALGETLEPWESAEVGVDVVMYHLEAARTIAHHGGIYRSNAEAKLQGLQEQAEIHEIFQTEFQMRLLWGSRGSEGSQSERYEKFDKVLTALSHKLEPPVRHSEL
ncbi:SH2 domain-containing protein 3C-like isoform X2 [Solea senegalensis]|uniref:SH2 domain-containing protein 3C-like isoform X2 n=1 Tax=Solea senegalensis TaxID=28829 RepID=A0AAV6R5U5_SOLSE|nr:SH2 domain-containing protein 3C isoform X2 [Solea senegalensis]KAG7499800.1 SH2 domain-containing protein 3C-like isoform X2 [Solea senegalensis]